MNREIITGPVKIVVHEQLCIFKLFVKVVLMSLCRITLQSRSANENNTAFL